MVATKSVISLVDTTFQSLASFELVSHIFSNLSFKCTCSITLIFKDLRFWHKLDINYCIDVYSSKFRVRLNKTPVLCIEGMRMKFCWVINSDLNCLPDPMRSRFMFSDIYLTTPFPPTSFYCGIIYVTIKSTRFKCKFDEFW